MATNRFDKPSLWERVEDARRRWLHAHDGVKQISEAAASMSTQGGVYAYRHAVHVEALAVKNYLSALQVFHAAVTPAPWQAVEDAGITPRERQVLALIASGRSSKEIAAELGMAVNCRVPSLLSPKEAQSPQHR